MALSSGTRLGAYEIVGVLGIGGMGEVYRARDTRLGRGVAVKVLPEAVEHDPDRIARFEREANALAALNHPHIATLLGMEEADGRHFLVMELVEGLTLAERLHSGPIPLDETLRIAQQIAEALEAAHEIGIVHRDLKPANVKITPDDQVKVLDFGLAKAIERAPAAGNVSLSPTLSVMATGAGVILGTAPYMSPEQAKGHPADHRSDVFSFGSVLYEMLTGREPFRGETVPDILASVLARDPDWNALPSNVNPRLPALLHRCLHKHRKQRWQAIGDVRLELEAIADEPHGVPIASISSAPARPLWRRAAAVVAGALMVSAATAILLKSPAASPPAVARFSITLEEGQSFTNLGRRMIDISPDGSQVVFVANLQLYSRPIASLEARAISGTEKFGGVTNPTFSPDGRSITFYAVSDSTIKRVALAGGATVTLCPTTNPTGVDWQGDSIVFAQEGPESSAIMRVSANGGQPEMLAKADANERIASPRMLPNGNAVLFTATPLTTGNRADSVKVRVVAQRIPDGGRTVLVDRGADGRYVASGHLVYGFGGVVFAVPFDATRLAVTGTQVPVIEGVGRASATGAMHFAMSATGAVAYLPGAVSTGSGVSSELAIFDEAGTAHPLKIPPGAYDQLRISPDGKYIVFVSSTENNEQALAVYDLTGTTSPRRLTFGGVNQFPVWSADSQRITFQSDREGDGGIFWQRADGTAPAERLTKPEAGTTHIPHSWSPDGQTLLFDVVKGNTVTLWAFSARDRKAAPYGEVHSTVPTGAVFSPDGRWVAYTVSEGQQATSVGGRRAAVYVQSFPATAAKYQISPASESGHHPVWSPSGIELYYTPGSGTRLSAVTISTRPTFAFTPPIALTRLFRNLAPTSHRPYDVRPNGSTSAPSFVSTFGRSEDNAGRIDVILNWFEELKTRVPVR